MFQKSGIWSQCRYFIQKMVIFSFDFEFEEKICRILRPKINTFFLPKTPIFQLKVWAMTETAITCKQNMDFEMKRLKFCFLLNRTTLHLRIIFLQ